MGMMGGEEWVGFLIGVWVLCGEDDGADRITCGIVVQQEFGNSAQSKTFNTNRQSIQCYNLS